MISARKRFKFRRDKPIVEDTDSPYYGVYVPHPMLSPESLLLAIVWGTFIMAVWPAPHWMGLN